MLLSWRLSRLSAAPIAGSPLGNNRLRSLSASAISVALCNMLSLMRIKPHGHQTPVTGFPGPMRTSRDCFSKVTFLTEKVGEP
jgi:hypothetical protein